MLPVPEACAASPKKDVPECEALGIFGVTGQSLLDVACLGVRSKINGEKTHPLRLRMI